MAQRIPWQAQFFTLVGVLFILLGGCGNFPLILTIDNQTGQPICEVYISPHSETNFGENQLKEDERIESGQKHAFQVAAGEYDLLVRNCAQETVFAQDEVTAESHFTIGGADTQPLRLRNRTGVEICYVYFAPVQSGTWGEDQLAKVESIHSGETRIFHQPAGSYHVRAAGCDDQTIAETRDVDLTQPYEWVIAP